MFLFDKFLLKTEFAFICSGLDGIDMKSKMHTAVFIGVGITKEEFHIFYNESNLPVLIKKGSGMRVEGEVYAMTKLDLFKLDFYMSSQSLARKGQITVKLMDGREIEAWGYFYEPIDARKIFKKFKSSVEVQKN